MSQTKLPTFKFNGYDLPEGRQVAIHHDKESGNFYLRLSKPIGKITQETIESERNTMLREENGQLVQQIILAEDSALHLLALLYHYFEVDLEEEHD